MPAAFLSRRRSGVDGAVSAQAAVLHARSGSEEQARKLAQLIYWLRRMRRPGQLLVLFEYSNEAEREQVAFYAPLSRLRTEAETPEGAVYGALFTLSDEAKNAEALRHTETKDEENDIASLYDRLAPSTSAPQAAQPGSIECALLPHQLRALHWMKQRERVSYLGDDHVRNVQEALSCQVELAAVSTWQRAADQMPPVWPCAPLFKHASQSPVKRRRKTTKASESERDSPLPLDTCVPVRRSLLCENVSADRGARAESNVSFGGCGAESPLYASCLDPVALWWHISHALLCTFPPTVRGNMHGGVFADEMGLGKTLTIAALVADARESRSRQTNASAYAGSDDRDPLYPPLHAVPRRHSAGTAREDQPGLCGTAAEPREKSTRRDTGRPGLSHPHEDADTTDLLASNSTLVILPVSIVQQWLDEIHTHAPSLQTVVYAGVNLGGSFRDVDEGFMRRAGQAACEEDYFRRVCRQMAAADIVLCTYATLSRECDYSKEPRSGLRSPPTYRLRSALLHVEFQRLVLDEAQMVEGTAVSRHAHMASRIVARRRWVVSGTPAGRGGVSDLHALVTFLGHTDLSDEASYTEATMNAKRSLAVLGAIVWRTGKRSIARELALPTRTVVDVRVKLSPIERELYDALQSQLHALCAQSEGASSFPGLTLWKARLLLGDLRRTLVHPQLTRTWTARTEELQLVRGGSLSLAEIMQRMIDANEVELQQVERRLCQVLHSRAWVCISENAHQEARALYERSLALVENEEPLSGEGEPVVEETATASQVTFRHWLLLNLHCRAQLARLVEDSARADEIRAKAARRRESLLEPLTVREQQHRQVVESLAADLDARIRVIRWRWRRGAVSQRGLDKDEALRVTLRAAPADLATAPSPLERHVANQPSAALLRATLVHGCASLAEYAALLEGFVVAEVCKDAAVHGCARNPAGSLLAQIFTFADERETAELEDRVSRANSVLSRVEWALSRLIDVLLPGLRVWEYARVAPAVVAYLEGLGRADRSAREAHGAAWRAATSSGRDAHARISDILVQEPHACADVIEAFARAPMALRRRTHIAILAAEAARKRSAPALGADTRDSRRTQTNRVRFAVAEDNDHAENHAAHTYVMNMSSRELAQLVPAGESARSIVRGPWLASLSLRALASAERRRIPLPPAWVLSHPRIQAAKRAAGIEQLRENDAALSWTDAPSERVLDSAVGDAAARLGIVRKLRDVLRALGKLHSASQALLVESFVADTAENATPPRAAEPALGEQVEQDPAVPPNAGSQGLSEDSPSSAEQTAALVFAAPMSPVEAKRKQRHLEDQCVSLRARKRFLQSRLAEHERAMSFAERDADPCPVCYVPLRDAEHCVVTSCAHMFCGSCATRLLAAHYPSCAICRTALRPERVFHISSARMHSIADAGDDIDRIPIRGSFGAKIERMLRLVRHVTATDPSAKLLVFTHWKDVADALVTRALHVNGIGCVRMGSSLVGRARAIRRFNSDNDTRVFVLALAEGAAGLTLIRANHVILLEPVLDPAVEDQAVSRIHRLGQQRPCFVHRFIADCAVDEVYVDEQAQRRRYRRRSGVDTSLRGHPRRDLNGADTEIVSLALRVAQSASP